jgi:hypothetical protein
MLYSILAYGLTLLSAITIWAFVGVVLKFLMLAVIGLIVGKQKLLLNIFRFMPPTDFVSSALHGWLSFWFGTCLLFWFGQPLDFFLALFLSACFFIVDIPRIQKSFSAADLKASQNTELTNIMGGNPNVMGDMFKNFADNSPQMQQVKQNMRNTKIIVLIGKITGISLALLNLVYS